MSVLGWVGWTAVLACVLSLLWLSEVTTLGRVAGSFAALAIWCFVTFIWGWWESVDR